MASFGFGVDSGLRGWDGGGVRGRWTTTPLRARNSKGSGREGMTAGVWGEASTVSIDASCLYALSLDV